MLVVLAFLGKLSLAPRQAGAVYYVVAYHYGFAFYDRTFAEVPAMEAKAGEPVTLYIVAAHALPKETVLAYSERSLHTSIGGLSPGDPQIRQKLLEDFALGNIEHIVGITGLPVYVPTNVTPALNGKPFREGGPATLREAIEHGEPYCAQRGSRLFHRRDCGWVARIPEAERIYMKTMSEAREQGLNTCPVCEPWEPA